MIVTVDKKKLFVQTLAVLVFIFLSTSGIHAAIIDSTGGTTWPSGNFHPFGAPDTQSYGQTFIAPLVDTNLNNFSMYLNDRFDGSGTLDLKGYIAVWDGTNPTTILYTSGIQTMNAAGTIQEFLFNTGSLSLIGGNTYIAYLSIADLPSQSTSNFYMPTVVDTIPGVFVFKNTSDTNWVDPNIGNDVWFKANFSSAPVPEPGTMMLLGSGLAGLAGYGRRRFKK